MPTTAGPRPRARARPTKLEVRPPRRATSLAPLLTQLPLQAVARCRPRASSLPTSDRPAASAVAVTAATSATEVTAPATRPSSRARTSSPSPRGTTRPSRPRAALSTRATDSPLRRVALDGLRLLPLPGSSCPPSLLPPCSPNTSPIKKNSARSRSRSPPGAGPRWAATSTRARPEPSRRDSRARSPPRTAGLDPKALDDSLDSYNASRPPGSPDYDDRALALPPAQARSPVHQGEREREPERREEREPERREPERREERREPERRESARESDPTSAREIGRAHV